MNDKRFKLASKALAGIRVVDVAGPFGNYCGKLFADLGADVILVEPPTGAPSRFRPPVGKSQGEDLQFTFLYENAGKRSVCLDLDDAEDQEILRQISQSADLFIETEKPGVMSARGLGYDDFVATNPQLVYTSVTGFGQSGPYAHYECEDIVALALGGLLYLAGEPEKAPLAAYGFQAIGAGNLFAAVASLVAVLHAEQSKQGEFVDVSLQECVAMGLENAAQFYDLEKVIRKRTGSKLARAGLGVFPCKDGLIFLMAAGVNENKFWFKTLDWLNISGAEGIDLLRGDEWLQDAFLYTDEAKRRFAEVFEPFALKYDAETLYAEGQKNRVPICPVRTPTGVLDDRHLKFREYFVGSENNASILFPGAPYIMSATPWSQSGPAPALGQHSHEIIANPQAAFLQSGVVK